MVSDDDGPRPGPSTPPGAPSTQPGPPSALPPGLPGPPGPPDAVPPTPPGPPAALPPGPPDAVSPMPPGPPDAVSPMPPGPPAALPPGPPEPSGRSGAAGPWFERADLRVAVAVVAGLAVAGAALGVVWQAWSPPRMIGLVIRAGVIPDERETWIASDGRFAVIGLVVGAVAALVVWSRPAWRGWICAVALGVGGVAGSLLMDLVGRLTGGGRATGPVNGYVHLPVEVRAVPVLFVESAVALLGYLLLTAFTRRDDLGRPAEPPALSWPPA